MCDTIQDIRNRLANNNGLDSTVKAYYEPKDIFVEADKGRITLQKQVTELKEKTKDNEYIIKGKLREREETIQSMKDKYDTDIELLKNAISDMQQLLRNLAKLAEISQASIQKTFQ